MLVLSLFPGIGLLDKGFESQGFCVVRGPDLIFGGDIRSFSVPSDKFEGVIGGPPCPDFSKARRSVPTGDGLEMINHYIRIVLESNPAWWLAENVPSVPDIKIDGYSWQRLDLNALDFGSKQRRKRHIQFGSNDRTALNIERKDTRGGLSTVLASSDQPLHVKASLQGLPSNFDIPSFTRGALSRAIGNGVPFGMAKALAIAVKGRGNNFNLCACTCGRKLTGRQKYATGACRKRVFDRNVTLAGFNHCR